MTLLSLSLFLCSSVLEEETGSGSSSAFSRSGSVRSLFMVPRFRYHETGVLWSSCSSCSSHVNIRDGLGRTEEALHS